MRLLYLPLYTNKNLNGCSSYNIAKKFIANAVERGWFVHWVLPEVGKGSRFHYSGDPAAIEDDPRVMVHRVKTIDDQYLQTGVVPSEFLYRMFSHHEGKYHIDAVLTEKPASASYVKKLLQHPFTREAKTRDKMIGKASPLPVFVRDPFTKCARLHAISEVEELEQTLGYLTSYNLFLSKSDFDMAMEVAKKYLNFSQVKKLSDRSEVLPAGTSVDELKKIRESTPKREKFTLLIAERLKNGQKMDILDAGDYMFKRGYDMNIVVSSQTPFNQKTISNYPTLFEHAELYSANPREKYLPLAASCHAVITMPATHSYPQGLMEQLYLGLVAVLPNYPWVDAVLPNYPFKVPRNVKSMVAMLKWIEDNYEEAKERIAWVPKYIEDNYATKNMSEKTMQFIENTTNTLIGQASTSGAFRELVEDLKVDDITEGVLLGYINKRSRTGVDFDNSKHSASFGNYRSQVFRIMKSLGWEDVCDGPYVRFVRKG